MTFFKLLSRIMSYDALLSLSLCVGVHSGSHLYFEAIMCICSVYLMWKNISNHLWKSLPDIRCTCSYYPPSIILSVTGGWRRWF